MHSEVARVMLGLTLNDPLQSALDKIESPELFFGLVAPIGINLEAIEKDLESSLEDVGYTVSSISLTKEMLQIKTGIELREEPFFDRYDSRIRYANRVRSGTRRRDALALLSVAAIRERRFQVTGSFKIAAHKRAYIIRQLKLPEEIETLRNLYGPQFVVVSVYAGEERRVSNLVAKAKADKFAPYDAEEALETAHSLIKRDYHELSVPFGQRLRDAFPKGDVFIDATNPTQSTPTIKRFVDALFGSNRVSPTMDEYGMYLARNASFRSLDLSRQVGAAIIRGHGEVVSLGCNEVPAFEVGTYWSPETQHRDFFVGSDPNDIEKTRVLVDVVENMKAKGFFSEEVSAMDSRSLLKRMLNKGDRYYIGDAKVLDLLEFGRIIHAEMCAICDAARVGTSVRGATMYCTTFPCHMCAKHIVASGIHKVVFLEPYPKSQALQLHGDSISIDLDVPGKVRFISFIWIAPQRYSAVFEKGRRKDAEGRALDWYEAEARPRMAITTERGYLDAEDLLVAAFFALVTERSEALLSTAVETGEGQEGVEPALQSVRAPETPAGTHISDRVNPSPKAN